MPCTSTNACSIRRNPSSRCDKKAMNYFRLILDRVKAELQQLQAAGTIPAGLDFKSVGIDPPKDPKHGDVSTNAAMVLAGPAKMKPRDIAVPLAERLKNFPDTE